MSANRSGWPEGAEPSSAAWTLDGVCRGRTDDLASCADRLGRFLRGLAATDRTLARWYDEDDQPVALDPAAMHALVERSRQDDDPEGTFGSIVLLHNGQDDERGAAIVEIVCGAGSAYVPDTLAVTLPRPDDAPDLYRRDRMIGLLDVAIDAWQPDWCRVRPQHPGAAATDPHSLAALSSWLVYLDHAVYSRAGELPAGVRALAREHGELFVLADTPQQLDPPTIDALRAAITFTPDWTDLA
ncbi:hypothetical protein Athai_40750 [Actinocatenispora thailandica]|uniref:Immunity protein 52 domain-containing protein n=1 Tax=Actinocatenispora thailandica TaxID=227318 RepID=A0A7R7DS72_9ACTN|nr:Imm52 family immunity protein [Actinocatenispora thailandica]BCJ36572.1 hypothetical protein Athai_40750 [Actinocatenispora thailandica]